MKEFLQKYWLWIVIIIAIIIIVTLVVKSNSKPKPSPITPKINTYNPNATNSVAQVINSLSGLGAVIGSWGIFGSGSSSSDSSSVQTDTTGGVDSSTFGGDVTTNPSTVTRLK